MILSISWLFEKFEKVEEGIFSDIDNTWFNCWVEWVDYLVIKHLVEINSQ